MDGSTTLTVRKYYNGLGQLLQTQLLGATVMDGSCDDPGSPDTCDILVDYDYDTSGRLYRQSLPHAVYTDTGYLAPTWTSLDYTKTIYDTVGRPYQQTATDGNTVLAEYAYGLIAPDSTDPFGFSFTTVTNANDVDTMSITNVWGQTVEVRPAITNTTTLETLGPWMFYEYDELGRLTEAHKIASGEVFTDTYATTVSIVYDVGGRKISMDDPDMGEWTYAYDALGNLLSQTDARDCKISFAYDELSRPITKTAEIVSQGSCGTDTGDVVFFYDDYTGSIFTGYNGSTDNAVGRRTGMSDPSGYTWWSYDERGRVITETKSITGYTDPFVTTWTYNNGDQMVTVVYPSGEVVTSTYLTQGLPDTVTGDSTYLVDSTYDESGRLLERQFITSTIPMTVTYGYWPWGTANGWGRLETMQATEPNGTTGDLLDIYYGTSSSTTPGYDANGNITRIETETTNGSEYQLYTYDDLDRLSSWSKCVSMCIGTTNYGYDDFGRLTGLGGSGTYTYTSTTSGTPFHAVLGTTQGWSYDYDANGSMITRTVVEDSTTVTYTLGYDQDNRMIDVDKDGSDNFDFVYDGDGNRVKATDQSTGDVTYYVGSYFEVTVEDSTPVGQYCSAPAVSIPNNNSSGVTDTITISGTSGTISDLDIYLEVTHGRVGELVATLKHVDTGTTITLMDRPGYPPRSGLCSGSDIDGTFTDDGTSDTAEDNCLSSTPALSGIFQPDGSLADYDLESLNGDWVITVSDNYSGSYTGTLDSWCVDATGPTADSLGREPVVGAPDESLGRMALFLPLRPYSSLLYDAAAWLAGRILKHGRALATARQALEGLKGGLLAATAPPSGEVWKSYYYAGGQRIAMRVQDLAATDTDATYYLLGDHLGSTSVVADENGDYYSELRYKPFGEVRFDSGETSGDDTPTGYQYTGQYSHESDFGLLFYNARWYDPYLNQFTQPDSIIPEAGNIADYNRFAYARYNPAYRT